MTDCAIPTPGAVFVLSMAIAFVCIAIGMLFGWAIWAR